MVVDLGVVVLVLLVVGLLVVVVVILVLSVLSVLSVLCVVVAAVALAAADAAANSSFDSMKCPLVVLNLDRCPFCTFLDHGLGVLNPHSSSTSCPGCALSSSRGEVTPETLVRSTVFVPSMLNILFVAFVRGLRWLPSLSVVLVSLVLFAVGWPSFPLAPPGMFNIVHLRSRTTPVS